MKYANDRGVKNIALVGKDEMSEGVLQVKNMDSGDQQKMTFEEVINYFTK